MNDALRAYIEADRARDERRHRADPYSNREMRHARGESGLFPGPVVDGFGIGTSILASWRSNGFMPALRAIRFGRHLMPGGIDECRTRYRYRVDQDADRVRSRATYVRRSRTIGIRSGQECDDRGRSGIVAMV